MVTQRNQNQISCPPTVRSLNPRMCHEPGPIFAITPIQADGLGIHMAVVIGLVCNGLPFRRVVPRRF